MRFVAALSALTFFCFLAVPVFAATHTGPEELQLTVPDDWSIPKGPPGAFGAKSPDGEFGVFMSAIPAPVATIKEGVKAFEAQIRALMKDAKMDKGKDRKHNGLETHWMSGKGTLPADPPEKATFGAVIIKAPTGKIVLVMAMGKEAAFGKNKAALLGIFESLKPAKSGKKKPAKK